MRIKTSFQDEFLFHGSDERGFTVPMDAGDAALKGQARGTTPKNLFLMAIAGCTGMDVVSILRKMRTDPSGLSITVEGKTADSEPKVFTDVRIVYEFPSPGPEPGKAEKAIRLSQDKYCALSAIAKGTARVTWECRIAGETAFAEK